MSDKILEVRSEDERRQLQRRAPDRDLASRVATLERIASDYRLSVARLEQRQRERRYQILNAAALLVSSSRTHYLDWEVALETAEKMLTTLERKDSTDAPTGE